MQSIRWNSQTAEAIQRQLDRASAALLEYHGHLKASAGDLLGKGAFPRDTLPELCLQLERMRNLAYDLDDLSMLVRCADSRMDYAERKLLHQLKGMDEDGNNAEPFTGGMLMPSTIRLMNRQIFRATLGMVDFPPFPNGVTKAVADLPTAPPMLPL